MNKKTVNFIKNISLTFSSNLVSLIISTIVVLIIPKLIGIEEYGYWQLYIFYSAYVGFLHFGWNDGIYLRYGGFEYKNLDKRVFFSQFIQLLIIQLMIGILIWFGAVIFVKNVNREYIIKMIAIVTVIMNIRYMFLFILQATNRVKECAQITLIDRFAYIFLVMTFLILGLRDFKLMIFSDIVAKVLSLLIIMLLCKDIVFRRLSTFHLSISESFMNISAGIKLMIANIASLLIIGIVRFGIEITWDVATFGKISLTLSISNMMMVFINSIGMILFPILRRTNQDRLANIYSTLRDFLMILLLGFLVVYYPLKTIISAWLPQYAESLLYMSLVFPMFIYEGKMALLINTYLKTLRKEKIMLKINIISMMISVILTYISTQLFINLDLSILNIVILLVLKSALAEYYLTKELNIKVLKDYVLELFLTIVFISTGWFINSWITTILYFLTYLIYIVIKKEDLKAMISNINLLLKS